MRSLLACLLLMVSLPLMRAETFELGSAKFEIPPGWKHFPPNAQAAVSAPPNGSMRNANGTEWIFYAARCARQPFTKDWRTIETGTSNGIDYSILECQIGGSPMRVISVPAWKAYFDIRIPKTPQMEAGDTPCLAGEAYERAYADARAAILSALGR